METACTALLDSLRCRLCLGQMKDLKSLPCGHAYCEKCLLIRTKDEYVCPECNVPFFCNDLNRNFPMRHLLDLCASLTYSQGDLVNVSRNLKPGSNREGGLARVLSCSSSSLRVRYVVSCRADVVNMSEVKKFQPLETKRRRRIVLTGCKGDLTKGIELNSCTVSNSGLGASVVVCGRGKLRRTVKLMCAMATADAIVSDQWLLDSAERQTGLDLASYQISLDSWQQQNWNFSLRESLSTRILVLQGYRVRFHPRQKNEFNRIVLSAGGSLTSGKKLMLVTDENDAANIRPDADVVLSLDKFFTAILSKKLPEQSERLDHSTIVAKEEEEEPTRNEAEDRQVFPTPTETCDEPTFPASPSSVPCDAIEADLSIAHVDREPHSVAHEDKGSIVPSNEDDPTLDEPCSSTDDQLHDARPSFEDLSSQSSEGAKATQEQTLDMDGINALLAWGDEAKRAYEERKLTARDDHQESQRLIERRDFRGLLVPQDGTPLDNDDDPYGCEDDDDTRDEDDEAALLPIFEDDEIDHNEARKRSKSPSSSTKVQKLITSSPFGFSSSPSSRQRRKKRPQRSPTFSPPRFSSSKKKRRTPLQSHSTNSERWISSNRTIPSHFRRMTDI